MMLQAFIGTIQRFSVFKRWFWRRVYQLLASEITRPDVVFMNYGWAPSEGEDPSLSLAESDEINRNYIQLYHHVIRDLDLEEKVVLEVGSGRGGGASWVARSSGAASVTGLDFSPNAVDLSRRIHPVPNLVFEVGDAENLPMPDASVDVVYNVESSHCYGDLARFFQEVSRVLKPGGVFCWADLWPVARLDVVMRAMDGTALERVRDDTITEGVLHGLVRENETKAQILDEECPSWLQGIARTFAGQSGTAVHESFKDGTMTYRCHRYVKAP